MQLRKRELLIFCADNTREESFDWSKGRVTDGSLVLFFFKKKKRRKESEQKLRIDKSSIKIVLKSSTESLKKSAPSGIRNRVLRQ